MARRTPQPQPMPEIPTRTEAAAWLLSTQEGLDQCEIAERLSLSQPAVSRAIARAEQKIASVIEADVTDRESLIEILRRGVGLAAAT